MSLNDFEHSLRGLIAAEVLNERGVFNPEADMNKVRDFTNSILEAYRKTHTTTYLGHAIIPDTRLWEPTREYLTGTILKHNGQYFIAVTDNKNVEPRAGDHAGVLVWHHIEELNDDSRLDRTA